MVPDDIDEEASWSCWLRTVVAGIGAMLSLVFVGMNQAQSAVMLPQLRKAESFIRVTVSEETWIASLSLAMAPIAAIFIGPFLDRFGRKIGLQYFYLTTGLGYVVIAFAREVYQIYIGRILCGIGTGLITCAVVYMVEICTTKQREYFFCITSALFAIGVTVMSSTSGYLPWHIVSFVFSVIAFILLIGQCFIPESPAWLFSMGREEACIASLQRLGRSETAIQRELATFRLLCTDDKEKVELRTFIEPYVWKPFVIMVVLFFFQSATGITDLFFYSVDFIKRLDTNYNPIHIAVMLSAVRLLTSCTLVIFFRSRVGRKMAVATSTLWMTVAFFALGAYEYVYRDVTAAERRFHWFPVASIFIYMAASNYGLIGLPSVMTGEVFPLRVRGTMTGVTHVIAHAILFVFVKTHFTRTSQFQMYELLFSYAGVSLTAVLFAIFILPETRHKSLVEIKQGFMPKRSKKNKRNTIRVPADTTQRQGDT